MAGCAASQAARIGRHCAIGGAARIIGHLTIADYVTISAAAVVTNPSRARPLFRRAASHRPECEDGGASAQLDRLAKRIRELEKRSL